MEIPHWFWWVSRENAFHQIGCGRLSLNGVVIAKMAVTQSTKTIRNSVPPPITEREKNKETTKKKNNFKWKEMKHRKWIQLLCEIAPTPQQTLVNNTHFLPSSPYIFNTFSVRLTTPESKQCFSERANRTNEMKKKLKSNPRNTHSIYTHMMVFNHHVEHSQRFSAFSSYIKLWKPIPFRLSHSICRNFLLYIFIISKQNIFSFFFLFVCRSCFLYFTFSGSERFFFRTISIMGAKCVSEHRIFFGSFHFVYILIPFSLHILFIPRFHFHFWVYLYLNFVRTFHCLGGLLFKLLFYVHWNVSMTIKNYRTVLEAQKTFFCAIIPTSKWDLVE